MKKFRFRGCQIAYEEKGAGEPMVFLHNGGNDHQVWEHQIAHFSRTHHVFALDHLGFGESDKPHIELPLSLYSEAIQTFIESLNLYPVTLIGVCMGGAMSFDYTLRHPARVRKLILCNITSQKILSAGRLNKIYQQFSQDREARESYIAGIEATGMTRQETDRLLRSQYGANLPDDAAFFDYIFKLYNRPGQMRSLYVVLSNFDHYRSPDEFEKPADFPPVFVIWGKENFILPVEAGEEFCERLQPQRAEILDGCGHLLMREKPDLTNQLIHEFLAYQPVARHSSLF